MSERQQKLIQTLCIHLAVASGIINLDEAASAMGVDRFRLKADRKRALEYAESVVAPLVKNGKR